MTKLLSEMTLDEMTPDQRARMLDHERFAAENQRWAVSMPEIGQAAASAAAAASADG